MGLRPHTSFMRHEAEIVPEALSEPRPLGRSLLRGWRRRCPNCGGGPLYDGYLKVRHSCAACGQELHHHRADDMPAWATIFITGHILVSGLVTVELTWAPPIWVHWALWPALTLLLSLWFLPRIKGMVVAMQWSFGMHGFGGHEDGGDAGQGGSSAP